MRANIRLANGSARPYITKRLTLHIVGHSKSGSYSLQTPPQKGILRTGEVNPPLTRTKSWASAGVNTVMQVVIAEATHNMKGAAVSWTDERVEILTKLWAEGLSASRIAGQLGGVTRNAVIGKVHRLGLSGRVTAKPDASVPVPTFPGNALLSNAFPPAPQSGRGGMSEVNLP